ncbi:MAG: Uma2 family endonuclease [Caldilineaceae bacterium SB0662_bin_9]|uniref:Uma2 family endonuclease n=1 Tax=Caldilineaceae bacterium SB0662_bin_9 TaxID=2605258 RepID=A0A6B1DPR8_9CHLR|nr:Uma2 family endonuclease [Caldilineaceae bacterium SB0662_bin_9]
MATPKAREQERIGTEGDAANGTADRPFNGAATVALPPLPAAPVPGSAAWWATIRALTHYDPAYPYDPTYEYDDEYTTDPDYGVDGVTYLTTEPHKEALASFKDTVDALRGPCAWREFTVHLSDTVRQALPPDHEFRNKGHLIPDVAVLPEVFMPGEPLPRACRLEVDPPPLLVLEVLSESTWQSDLGPKLDTYAAMGIAEYWLYDPEGHAPPAYADGVSFWGWRLDDTGSYVRIPRQPGKGEWAVYHSKVLAADIRMLPAAARDMDVGIPDETGSRHWLQWWDPDQGLWRDREVDAERRRQTEVERQVQEAQAETERKTQEARLDERIAGMHSLLETELSGALLAQIEANWHRAGQGRTASEVAAVLLGQADWRSLLFPDQPDSQGSNKP